MSDAGARASLLVIRDCRERAIQRLSDCYATEVLSVEEFEELLERVHAATSEAEVEALVASLTPPAAGASRTALASLSVTPALPAQAKRIRAILGNVERRGAWTVPARLEVSATFGNVELDFRTARFTAGVTEVFGRAVFGNLEIIVPPQLAVECEGSSVLGNVTSHGSGAIADPDRPLLRIRGVAVFGNVEVHTRLPGESARDAHRRGRREGRALPDAEQARPRPLGPIRPE